MSRITGKVAQIIGPVVDVVFNDANAELPKIYDSLEITKKDGTLLVLEVQSHIGEKYSTYHFYGFYGWFGKRC